MGLTDEAIVPAQEAARTRRATGSRPRQRWAASTQGQARRRSAIEWLERAAEDPAPREEDSRALLFQSRHHGRRERETARALAVFLELQAEAGDYRDVRSAVERLARVQAGG